MYVYTYNLLYITGMFCIVFSTSSSQLELLHNYTQGIMLYLCTTCMYVWAAMPQIPAAPTLGIDASERRASVTL